LADGRVIIAGGTDGSGVLDTVDIYDPVTNNVSAAGTLSTPRAGLSMTRLLDAKILIAGGFNGSAELASAEVFDPQTGTFAATGSMATPRRDHLSFRLPDNNQVLVVGGTSGGTVQISMVEHPYGDQPPTVTIQVDGAGNLISSSATPAFAPDTNDLGVTFYVTATQTYRDLTGATRILTAQTSFTDDTPYHLTLASNVPNGTP